MKSYLKGAATPRKTPQTEAIPGRESEMTKNTAGGVTFVVSPLERLRRFLILGSEGGTYYVDERKHTAQAVAGVRAALDAEGVAAVETIAEISEAGRAPKNDPAIYALAVAAAHPNIDVRKAAWFAVPRVCRIGTHLFHFAEFVEDQRGWGKGLKRAVAEWYYGDPTRLAYQLVKYRQRDGWSHDDLLRLTHAEPPSPMHAGLYEWVSKPEGGSRLPKATRDELPPIIDAFEQAQSSPSPAATAGMIRQYEGLLPREALVSEHLTDPDVNRALLEGGMPMGALIRNLANLTRYGVLEPMGTYTSTVVEQITDGEKLKKARLHPIQVLSAFMTYQSGASVRGSSTWTPIREIIDALDAAFYASFANVERTGKRHMLALDVSGSMTMGMIAGVPGLTPGVAAAVMSMVQAHAGDPYAVYGFGGHFEALNISPRQRLDDIYRDIYRRNFGRTDCALPMIHASNAGMEIDAFVVYTDNETWAGRAQHPVQALAEYRQRSGIDAKLIVVGMTSTGFTIADPQDAGMLDVVGFDTNAPQVIGEFAAGRI